MNRENEQLLISATTSERRNLALQQLAGVNLRIHPGPKNELESEDTTLVAADKAAYLVELIRATACNPETSFLVTAALTEIVRLIDQFAGNFKVIAADVRTETLENENAAVDKFVSHGKPKNLAEFQRTLAQMSRAQVSIYRVFAGSQILEYHPEDELPLETKHAQRIGIRLKPERLRQLNTDKGLEEYINRFREFYSSKAYSKNGLPAIDFTDISAGLSLPVLIQGNYVDSVSLGNQEFQLAETPKRLLKEIIYGVAVGYSPHVLDKIYHGAYDFIIDNWNWLEDVINHVKK